MKSMAAAVYVLVAPKQQCSYFQESVVEGLSFCIAKFFFIDWFCFSIKNNIKILAFQFIKTVHKIVVF